MGESHEQVMLNYVRALWELALEMPLELVEMEKVPGGWQLRLVTGEAPSGHDAAQHADEGE